jgi:hypothetical protein
LLDYREKVLAALEKLKQDIERSMIFAKFVTFETGGHLLIGHGDEARAAVKNFLQEHEAPEIVR